MSLLIGAPRPSDAPLSGGPAYDSESDLGSEVECEAPAQTEEAPVQAPDTASAALQQPRKRKKHSQKKAPGAPKRGRTAYILFTIDKRPAVKASMPPGPTHSREIAKRLGELWRGLDDESKQVYEDKAKRDKERYTRELRFYEGPLKVPKERRKDYNAPKRGMSAFLQYSSEMRAQMKSRNPNATNAEISKLLGVEWKQLSDEEKAPYKAKADKDGERYRREMEQYKRNKSQIHTLNSYIAQIAQEHVDSLSEEDSSGASLSEDSLRSSDEQDEDEGEILYENENGGGGEGEEEDPDVFGGMEMFVPSDSEDEADHEDDHDEDEDEDEDKGPIIGGVLEEFGYPPELSASEGEGEYD
ncbi:unnamed protein product [Chrysoparadoxa australica]